MLTIARQIGRSGQHWHCLQTLHLPMTVLRLRMLFEWVKCRLGFHNRTIVPHSYLWVSGSELCPEIACDPGLTMSLLKTSEIWDRSCRKVEDTSFFWILSCIKPALPQVEYFIIWAPGGIPSLNSGLILCPQPSESTGSRRVILNNISTRWGWSWRHCLPY